MLKTRTQYIQFMRDKPPHTSIVVKFGAKWCAPCKTVNPILNEFNNDSIIRVNIDIDESPDIYAFFRGKRLITGVPTLFYYAPDNNHYVPSNFLVGTAGVREFLHGIYK